MPVVMFLNIALVVYSQREKYLSRDYWNRFPVLKQEYLDSQYVNKHPKNLIRDEVLFSYASGAYIKGINPVLVNAEMPPLGKYIIGFSIILFQNENVVIVLFSVLSLLGIFLVGRQVFGSNILALIPPTLFSFEPIFKNQLIYVPLLDIIQLPFLLFSLYYFNKGLLSKKSFIFFAAANLFLDLFISTKFFITGFTIILAWFAVLFFQKQKEKIKNLALTLPISFLILVLSYLRIFFFGYSFREFLGVQKWVFLYHKSQLFIPFTIWPLILANKWIVWYGTQRIISDSQWFISWPIVTVLSVVTIALYLLRKIKHNTLLDIIVAWTIFYVALFSFGEISSRYFVILIPTFYILSLYGIIEIKKMKFAKPKK